MLDTEPCEPEVDPSWTAPSPEWEVGIQLSGNMSLPEIPRTDGTNLKKKNTTPTTTTKREKNELPWL